MVLIFELKWNSISHKCNCLLVLKRYLCFVGVAMAANTIALTSTTLVLAVILGLKTTAQGPLTRDPNRARDQRLDTLRADPGILSIFSFLTLLFAYVYIWFKTVSVLLILSSRPVSSVQSATNVVNSTSFAGDQSQPIVISDTPSPAVSIITIHSDSEDEDDTKFPAAWWASFSIWSPYVALLSFPQLLVVSNKNVISKTFYSSSFLPQLWNKSENQCDQLCDCARLPWLRLLYQQPPEPQNLLSAYKVSSSHHALS